ncbi:MAG: SUF system NifU family Fe-S cluster assembly protein [Clostridia bacterium]|nr:SUF system NifU family Fe-S cluster assembly protein [Clostridia bacterium]
MELDEIYTELVMEHSTNSPYKKELTSPTACMHGHNPNCGDDITLEIITDGKVITNLAFTGHGCAISQSSTSIMIQTLIGKPLLEAKSIIETYLKMIKREKLTTKQKSVLHDAVAFENISNMPARVKCATMPWHTMQDLLSQVNDLLSKK